MNIKLKYFTSLVINEFKYFNIFHNILNYFILFYDFYRDPCNDIIDRNKNLNMLCNTDKDIYKKTII